MSLFILGVFLVLMFLGIPVAVSLGMASLGAILMYDTSTIASAVKLMYSSMNSFTMVAVPLFFLAGILMDKGGVAEQIFSFCEDVVGWIHGGLGHVNIMTSILFAGMSGSSVADVASIGALCANAMIRSGYPSPYAWGTTLASSMLASVIPPSILMVVAASVAQVSMGQALFAGIIPGVFLGLVMMVYNYFYCKKHGIGHRIPFNGGRLWKSFKRALPALMVPVILLGGMYTGYFTSTEAAAICVLYTLIVSMFVYKKLTFKDLPGIFMSVAKSTGTVHEDTRRSALHSGRLPRSGLLRDHRPDSEFHRRHDPDFPAAVRDRYVHGRYRSNLYLHAHPSAHGCVCWDQPPVLRGLYGHRSVLRPDHASCRRVPVRCLQRIRYVD